MKKSQNTFLFTKTNYVLMALGVFVILLGFFVMSGGNDPDPTRFNEAIFSSRRIFWAPLIVIVGFVVEITAIFYTPKRRPSDKLG